MEILISLMHAYMYFMGTESLAPVGKVMGQSHRVLQKKLRK